MSKLLRLRLCVLLCVATAGRAQGPAAPPTRSDQVTVTADRGLAGTVDASASLVVLTQQQLTAPPALTLDESLRQVAGFQLFRRTSSWTANPTTQGVSLRGLGSTAASRTLVLSDQVPLLDPFGGWVHWDEIPQRAIKGVALLRGGAANLYGSSAIGGIIDLVPVVPAKGLRSFDLDGLGANEHTGSGNMLALFGTQRMGALAAGSVLSTGGYRTIAPAFRGLVDVPSNVTSRSGRLELRRGFDTRTAFLRGNVLDEARSNGTPLQINSTRLWRYSGGADRDLGAWAAALRVFGSHERYRQSFSAIAPDRNSERLTRLQGVPVNELGAALQTSGALHAVALAFGADVRDIRANDTEMPVTNGVAASTIATTARQRAAGAFVASGWQPRGWSVFGSLRGDSFRTFDAATLSASTRPASPIARSVQPTLSEVMISPHLGLVRRLPHSVSLFADGFRAFRGPTLNELYRTGQVGQQTTLANNSLLAERATGFEAGFESSTPRLGSLRASWFWTEVNRPISAVLLTQTATQQTLQRLNLGQIRSQGLSLQATTSAWRGLTATGSYQLAVATVTLYRSPSPFQRNLLGLWIPQVPRQSVNVELTYLSRLGEAHLFSLYSGQQFDDAENQYKLHAYSRFDVSFERKLHHGVSGFFGVQNLGDRSIDAGRTPVLTLAPPRIIQAGIRLHLER